MNRRQRQVDRAQMESEKKVLESLKRMYHRALKDINQRILELEKNQQTKSRIHQVEYQQRLKRDVSQVLMKLYDGEYKSVRDFLNESYELGYIGTLYDVAGQTGVPLLVPMDREKIVKAVTLESKISEDLYTALGKDIGQMKKAIREEVTRGLATGMTKSEIVKNLVEVLQLPFNRVKTIVQTESHRIHEEAAEDARQKSKAAGADVLKKWFSKKDEKTRSSHRRLDGQIKETDEPFELDGKKAMMPGHFGIPSEDINCRCQALTYARWMMDETMLDEMKARAEYFGIDKSTEFEDFRRRFLSIEKKENSGIMINGDVYESQKGFEIHKRKITKFLLQQGAKHYKEFLQVGLCEGNDDLLVSMIEAGYDEERAVNRKVLADGAERFSIFMMIGENGGKQFRTVWQREQKGAKPRLITAHRE